MILPSKHLSQGRSIIAISGEILVQLDEARAVSELWERVSSGRSHKAGTAPLSFDWFVLALTFLHIIFAVEMDHGIVARSERSW